jgi:hypothetical protein
MASTKTAKRWNVGARVALVGTPRSEEAKESGTVAHVDGDVVIVNWDPPSERGPFVTTRHRSWQLRASRKLGLGSARRGGAGGCFTQYVSGGGGGGRYVWMGPGRPIVIAKVRGGYTVTAHGVPLVTAEDGSVVFATQPEGMTKRPKLGPPGARPYVFKKIADAKWTAHKIGHYMLHLGDLAFSYVELPPGSRW